MNLWTRRAVAFLVAFAIAVWIGTAIVPKKTGIYLLAPRIGEKVSSPLVVRGEAPGTWFFEGSFPVILTNWDGLIIAQGIAQAKGEWMTENLVPFSATLTFDSPKPIAGVVNRGSLILKKDNPSDLPQNDDALEIEVMF